MKMELPQLVGRADVIFVGKVTKVQSLWNEGGRHIVTDTTFEVEQIIKGTATLSKIVVRNLGGSVDGLGMWVSGSPAFSQGDQAVIFSDLREKHRYVTGMQQGVFHITHDLATKQPKVQTRIGGLALAKRTGTGLELLNSAPIQPRPLKDFIAEVKQLIDICTKDQSRCITQ